MTNVIQFRANEQRSIIATMVDVTADWPERLGLHSRLSLLACEVYGAVTALADAVHLKAERDYPLAYDPCGRLIHVPDRLFSVGTIKGFVDALTHLSALLGDLLAVVDVRHQRMTLRIARLLEAIDSATNAMQPLQYRLS